MIFTGFTLADPIVSAVIGLLIIRSAWSLLLESLNVLLESAPKGMNVRAVRSTLKSIPQVTDIHDLHIWSITAGQPVLTAHLEIEPHADPSAVLITAREELREHHGISHVTLQLETDGRICEVRDGLHP